MVELLRFLIYKLVLLSSLCICVFIPRRTTIKLKKSNRGRVNQDMLAWCIHTTIKDFSVVILDYKRRKQLIMLTLGNPNFLIISYGVLNIIYRSWVNCLESLLVFFFLSSDNYFFFIWFWINLPQKIFRVNYWVFSSSNSDQTFLW